MAKERSTEEIFDALFAQVVYLWGEEYAEQLRVALYSTAIEIAAITRHPLPPDIEPRFFT